MLVMKSKKESNTQIQLEEQLQSLKRENERLRDSLILQGGALEREKREKQQYMLKHQQLEKEKAEAVTKYQNLLMILIKNNIDFDDNPFPKVVVPGPPSQGSGIRETKDASSKAARTRTSVQRESTVYQSSLLNKILQNGVQTINQKQRSLQQARTKLKQYHQEPGKLVTLKEISGSSMEFRQPLRKQMSLEMGRQNSQQRLSYLEKLKQPRE